MAFHTLGCKLNYTETSSMSRMLDPDKYQIVRFNEVADIYVINTCTVTANADRKSNFAVNKAVNLNENAKIIVTGCLSQINPEKLSRNKNVSIILGNSQKSELPYYIKHAFNNSQIICTEGLSKSFFPSYSMNDRTRAFLKIQDGCDYFCSYCTVPYARGKSRNLSIKEVLENAEKISLSGAKEIVLSGINLGDFGKSTGETFLNLIRELEHIEGILRYRISSIEPNLISDEIIEYVSLSEKFVPHFHIPLQSGCNKILNLMKRRYTREIFTERINKIIELMPFAGIGADVITGFPGETDEDFNDTHEFIKSLKLSYLHVFTFSPRPGTPAYNYNEKVSEKDKIQRSNSLHKISDQLKRKFLIENDGNERKVLFESNNHKGNIFGYTDNYIRVAHPFDENMQNCLIKGKLSLSDEQMTLII